MSKNVIISFVFIIMGTICHGQQLPPYTQYLLNDYIINPAVGGTKDAFYAQSYYGYRLVGLTDAPRSLIFSLHGPFEGKNTSIGGYAMSDISGPTRITSFQLSYSYRTKLTEEIKLSFGLSGGFKQHLIDAGKLKLLDMNDIAISNGDQMAIVPDAGAGIYAYSDNLFFSLSVAQLFQSKLQYFDSYKQTLSELKQHFFLSSGYTFDIDNNLAIQPSFQVIYVTPTTLYEGALRLIYDDLIWLGASYRHQLAVGILAGIKIKDNFMIGYSYDVPLSVQNVNNGSHEIIAGLKFNHK